MNEGSVLKAVLKEVRILQCEESLPLCVVRFGFLGIDLYRTLVSDGRALTRISLKRSPPSLRTTGGSYHEPCGRFEAGGGAFFK